MSKYFLKCDISGIQPYIFNIPTQGAAKELKRRSDFIQTFSQQCLDEFKDKKVLYHGGGNFYIYLDTTKSYIDDIIKRIQDDNTTSDLYPYFAYIDNHEKNNVSEKIGLVNNELQKAQLRRSCSLSPFHPSIVRNQLDYSNINEINAQIPRNINGAPLTFEDIAKLSEGDKKLAALKLDVDNLGSLFRNRNEEEYKLLSDSLSRFFNKDLVALIKANRMQDNIYTVFSGGDDCFLIGSWNKIMDLALIIRKKFDDFQENKRKEYSTFPRDKITFSAGIIIIPMAYPMIRLVEEVEDALSMSKNKKEKNSITCFGYTLTWVEFAEAKKNALMLKEFLDQGESRSLLNVLRSENVNPYLKINYSEGQKMQMPEVWHLKYFLKNINRNKSEVESLFESYTISLLNTYLGKSAVYSPFIYPFASRWAELLTKK